MTGIRLDYSCRRDLHVLDPETDLDLGGDRRAVLEIDEIYPGFRGRRISRRSGLLRAGLEFEHPWPLSTRTIKQRLANRHMNQLPSYANMGLEDQQVGAETPIIRQSPGRHAIGRPRYPGKRHHELIIHGRMRRAVH